MCRRTRHRNMCHGRSTDSYMVPQHDSVSPSIIYTEYKYCMSLPLTYYPSTLVPNTRNRPKHGKLGTGTPRRPQTWFIARPGTHHTSNAVTWMPDRAAGVNQGAREGAMTGTHGVMARRHGTRHGTRHGPMLGVMARRHGKATGDSSQVRPVVEPVTGTYATVAAQIAILYHNMIQCHAIL